MQNPACRLASCVGSFFVAISLPFFALAQAPGIFSSLPYDTAFLQQKLAAYSQHYSADKDPSSVPDHLFTLLALRAILTDSTLLASLDGKDVAVIATLLAPEDQRFIVQDQAVLSAICTSVAAAESSAAIQELARRFDAAKTSKENALAGYYAAAVASFSVSSQKTIAHLRSELSTARHLTYSTFDLAGFAQEVPSAAKAILTQGCASFAQRSATFTPQTVTLGDQVSRS
ncbi:MAG: hypothetical protein LBF16_04150 [Pseudomonadales bacterium]|jgi:hypothetical protein|nr:hypothetical protein [Pseudomonadales bacterium]